MLKLGERQSDDGCSQIILWVHRALSAQRGHFKRDNGARARRCARPVMPPFDLAMCQAGKMWACAPPATDDWHRQRSILGDSIPNPENSTFVVVGAHHFGGKGEDNDSPFFLQLAARHRWGGVLLVEASPNIASELSQRLSKSSRPFVRTPLERIVVSNTGICPKSRIGQLPYYSISAPRGALPDWTDQIGSFNASHIRTFIPVIAKHMATNNPTSGGAWSADRLERSIVTRQVPCRTLQSELKRHDLPPPAVLLIDVEGMDCDIVAELDACKVRPWMLHFEHVHCSLSSRFRASQHIAKDYSCHGKEPNLFIPPVRDSCCDTSTLRDPKAHGLRLKKAKHSNSSGLGAPTSPTTGWGLESLRAPSVTTGGGQ